MELFGIQVVVTQEFKADLASGEQFSTANSLSTGVHVVSTNPLPATGATVEQLETATPGVVTWEQLVAVQLFQPAAA